MERLTARWMEALRRYKPEDGIIQELDLIVYLLFLMIQNGLDVGGDIAELGVYRGGPFALMTTMLKAVERAHAIDIFDLLAKHPDPEKRVANDPNVFQQTVLRVAGPGIPYQMVRGDSREPAQCQATIETVGRNCRFFHVDGDHRLVNIRADLRIAAACTADNAKPIIVVDDTFANIMPEVTEGLFEFLREHREWAVFLISPNKTLLCRRADHAFYFGCAARFLGKGLQGGPAKIQIRHLVDAPCLALRRDARPEINGFDLDVLRQLLANPPAIPVVPAGER